MAKRPIGFGNSAKQKKKIKQDSPAEPETSTEHASEAALNVELDDQIEKEAQGSQELEELFGLFKKLEESEAPDRKLVQGLIHECDSLLRQKNEESEGKLMPSRFYLVYGTSLLIHSFFQLDLPADDPDSTKNYIDAAIHQFDQGLEASPLCQELYPAKALGLIESLQDEIRVGDKSNIEQLKAVVEHEPLLKEFTQLLDKVDYSDSAAAERTASSIGVMNELFESLELFKPTEQLETQKSEIFNWAVASLEKIIAQSESQKAKRLAYKGLGTIYLSRASGLIDNVESAIENEEDDANVSVCDKTFQAAKMQLREAIECLDKALEDSDPQVYVQAAEARISLGNLEENESEGQQELYSKAIRLLKKAQRLGAGEFHDLIQSLEE